MTTDSREFDLIATLYNYIWNDLFDEQNRSLHADTTELKACSINQRHFPNFLKFLAETDSFAYACFVINGSLFTNKKIW